MQSSKIYIRLNCTHTTKLSCESDISTQNFSQFREGIATFKTHSIESNLRLFSSVKGDQNVESFMIQAAGTHLEQFKKEIRSEIMFKRNNWGFISLPISSPRSGVKTTFPFTTNGSMHQNWFKYSYKYVLTKIFKLFLFLLVSDLNNNSLEYIPENAFSNATELKYLWVH